MSDVKLPALAHSASTTAIGTATTAQTTTLASEVMQRAASQSSIRKSNSPQNATLPGLICLKFPPGRIGLSIDGATVTRSASHAWMKGVRPGWSIRTVAGQQVEENTVGQQAEELLEKAAEGNSRYEIGFEKGKSKFGIGADEVSKEELQREQNRKLLRRTFPFQSHIERVEHRGITFKQLERVRNFAEEWCYIWKDMAPPKVSKYSGLRLRMDFMNLHHINHWMILPSTEKRKCSFVELVATGRQVPSWCVVHWWGQPFVEFMACLQAHVRARRTATEESPYWIHAYASRQHVNESEIFEDPKTSSFFKAMLVTRFHLLLVLDEQATTFSRIWCGFEESACLDRATTPLDMAVYSSSNSRACILTQGLTEDEEELENRTRGEGIRAQSAREAEFPLSVAEVGLTVDFHKGEATNDDDRHRILNVVAGTDLKKDAPVEHPKYVETSRRLQALFASLLLRRATVEKPAKPATDETKVRIREALQEDLWRKSMDMHLEGLTTEGMELLVQSLPPNLQEIKLRLRGATITDADIRALAEDLPKRVKSVSLDLSDCEHITDDGRAEFGEIIEARSKGDGSKIEVDLNLRETEALQYIMECEQPKRDMVKALGVSICYSEEELAEGFGVETGERQDGKHIFRWFTPKPLTQLKSSNPKQTHAEELIRHQHQIQPAVPLMMKALNEPKPHIRCAAARALASFGEHAVSAVAALEKVVLEDPEVSVQQAAQKALNKIKGTGAS
mmetsp:Transcript_82629/g.130205  ORF Transcript_82629/g.130205 Transcript_82629/m.130205 type:complete len:736 (-) Transcript_82629:115-2322(-)